MDETNVLISLKNIYKDLFEQEKKVADFVMEHPSEVTNMSVTDLAEKSNASEATIMRLSKKAGYKGFYHFKIALARNIQDEKKETNFELDLNDYNTSIHNIFNYKMEELKKCDELINRDEAKQALELIKNCDTLYIFGAGNTNPLAVYAGYQFTQYGIRTNVDIGPEMQTNAAFRMTEKDACLLISNSGSTNMIVDIASIAKERNTPSIAITSYDKSPLVNLVEHVLLSFTSEKVYFEAISSTRMAHMAIIDMLLLLLSIDEDGKYHRYSSDREEFLAKYKS
ncbi:MULTISPECIES: MurR/RpiR family transcriptional regulator [Enterococcus]|uniref:MurR/RpiR family transcriptional regulator n=1 Tax=Enterococcus TaxID=1350 RepID=UPI000EB81F11|nr:MULTISPECIES: MurR/RpiR family transcriptional regulator [Enterococcus]HCM86061.1 sugar isomerase [Enterococcus sp.]